MIKFKNSSEAEEKDIFACMIQNLFDELKFFHRYPEKELLTTAELFGQIINHSIIDSVI